VGLMFCADDVTRLLGHLFEVVFGGGNESVGPAWPLTAW
jgi:hypothetical protein